ncbi:MAG: tail fiber protein [Fuerstiella sp.]
MTEPFLGEIMMVGFNFAPRGWSMCDGQILPISQYTALFSLLGTTFGGDGRTTFGLPGMRGRTAVHVGNGPGLDPVTWGSRGGANRHTLTVQQMPSHNHSIRGIDEDGNLSEPEGNYLPEKANGYHAGPPTVNMGSQAVTNNGGGQSFNIMQPYIGIYHCIATVGIYPSRN